MNDSKTPQMPHSVSMTDRRQLKLSGVCEVLSFDEETVSLRTECGAMQIEGKGMHITTLNIDRGDVVIDGRIDGMFYSGDGPAKSGFFGKLFG